MNDRGLGSECRDVAREGRIRGARERDEHRLETRLRDHTIVEKPDGDDVLGLARGDRQGTRDRPVVLIRVRRAVARRVLNRDRHIARGIEFDDEIGFARSEGQRGLRGGVEELEGIVTGGVP